MKNDDFKNTIGVIDTYCTETISKEQLREGINYIKLVNERTM